MGNLERALAESSIPAERPRREPYAAEIVPGCTPTWHILTTEPARETVAAAHLAGRRFGIYLPTIEARRGEGGRARIVPACMFPGYLFLFVWDLGRHWQRVRACPGVSGLLLAGEARPMSVPQPVIDAIFETEMRLMVRGGLLVRRPRRRRRFDDLDVVRITAKSYFSEIERLDAPARLGRLHLALGLTA